MLATTILAVSTAPGVGSRAVLRLSGPRAVTAVMALAVDGHVIEDVAGFSGVELELRFGGFDLLVWAVRFRAPRSYTREEMLELHVVSCTPLVAALCRALLRDEDVRWAGPGEFTLRAFTRGRIDLSQAEAVARLIAATGEEEARAARRALAGDLGREVESVVNVLTEALALIEAGIDFADEDLPEVAPDILLERLDDVGARITSLRASTSLRVADSGASHVVFAGLPNAGKSSLLNAVLGRPEAIVSDLEGTTRDPVRGVTNEGGVRVSWTDLAGTTSLDALQRESSSRTVARGLDRRMSDATRRAVRRLTDVELRAADTVLWVVDGTVAEDVSLADSRGIDASRRVLVVNKIDLLDDRVRRTWARRHPGACLVSAVTGAGIDVLRRLVADRSAGVRSGSGAEPSVEAPRYLTSAHQESALDEADDAMVRARSALNADHGNELAAADLRDALRALEDLAGTVTPDDVLGLIFSRFCVGK